MEKLNDLHAKTQEELRALVQKLQDTVASQHREIESLRYQLNKALQQRFGRKSEKDQENQLSLFNEVIEPSNLEEIVQAENEITVGNYGGNPSTSKTRKKANYSEFTTGATYS